MKGLKHAFHLAWAAGAAVSNTTNATTAIVGTTSGRLVGLQDDGLQIFKGVRYAQAPVDDLRWAPPKAFISSDVQNATQLGASCFQQFDSPIEAKFFGSGVALVQSEDCLFLNVWAPTPTNNTLKPVVIWIYGGVFEFGTSSLATYDGSSLAKNQDIVVVSLNYRINIFGFPISRDVPPAHNNLGLLDQELVFQWVQQNIVHFGGDKNQVTIMGQSAGAQSVSSALVRHSPSSAPFRAGIMYSGAVTYRNPIANYTPFDQFALAVNCTQDPGAERLACLRSVPASLISNLTNSDPSNLSFENTMVDNVTIFSDSLQRIQRGQFSKKPILIGNMENDGSIWSLLYTSIRQMLIVFLGPTFAATVTDDQIRALYPGQNDTTVIADFIRDDHYRCPASLYGKAFVDAGVSNVYRYTYGAVFQDLQYVPGLGAWHGSELIELFGTYNHTSASADERTLSVTFQTAMANFIKDPTSSPAENWPEYLPTNSSNTLAKLAYDGNVDPDNFVQAAPSLSVDGPCEELINQFLNYTGVP